MNKISLPSKRFANIPLGGGIRDIVDIANQKESNGQKVYHLEIGRPDFNSPQIAIKAAKTALDEGKVHYADMRGELELRMTLSAKLRKENGIDVAPENILITVGAQAALMTALMTTLDPGDEVIIPTPCFGAYISQSKILDLKIVRAPCKWEDGFILRAKDLDPLITPRTKAIIINSPNNPTGAVIPHSEIEQIAKLAIKNDLLVISDECYERFIYRGEHVSIASLPSMLERTATVGAASKTYSMTGWRVGYLAMPSWMTAYANRAHLSMNTCVATFPQYGYLAALLHAENDVKVMIQEYEARRDLVVQYLKTMKCLDFVVPEGAFYIFPDIQRTNMNAAEFCSYMLQEAGVALVPGEAFESPGSVRIAYCKPKEYLHEAMQSMKRTLDKLEEE